MNNKKTFITFGIVLVSVLGSVYPVNAATTEISIDGNGSSSNNEVTIKSESTTKVEQKNESNIENDVDTDINTGGNSASGNSGDTTIDTGDAQSDTTVINEDINQNYANVPSNSSSGISAHVSGNSSHSHNSVHVGSSHNTTVNQTNIAHVTNNVTTNANTGYNTVNWNTGDVTIKTGSIQADTHIENKRINTSIAKVNGMDCDGSCKTTQDLLLTIFGNGKGSINNLTFNIDDTTTFDSTNLANIYNDVVHKLNTGGNKANGNTDDVSIVTGDIKSSVTIINKDINSNYVEKDCGCEEKPGKPEEPEKPEEPVTPPSKGNGKGHVGGNGNGASQGDVLGAAIGEVLPATGNLFFLWATIASLIMFFAGWYLRFRSGLAPGR